jgi:hypothetical protein
VADVGRGFVHEQTEPGKITMNRPLRIGQIVPSSNTTMETEIPAMLRAREAIRPERFTFHSSRMRMHKVTKEELEAMNREGLRCAAEMNPRLARQLMETTPINPSERRGALPLAFPHQLNSYAICIESTFKMKTLAPSMARRAVQCV